MLRRRIMPGLLTSATLVIVLLVSKYDPDSTDAGDNPDADAPVVMPADLTGLLITFGIGDKEATVWDGQVSASKGKILAMDVSDGNAKKSTVKAGKFVLKSAFNKKTPKKNSPPALRVTVDAPAAARVNVNTKQGKFDFTLSDLPENGDAQKFLGGRVTVAREDGTIRLTRGETEHDYPALARDNDGTLWLAYADYTKGTPYVTERVLVGDFDALVPKGNGDQIRLKSYNGSTWGVAVDVTDKGHDIWRPTVTVAKGLVHVAWSQQVNGNWDIYHRAYTPPKNGAPGKWSAITKLTSEPGTDYNVVSATSATGQVWLAWQAWRNGRFQILARKLGVRDDGSLDLGAAEIQVTKAKANHWNPAIAADSAGLVYVGYDTYDKDNYDVHVAEISGASVRGHVIADSARFEARVSLACDKQNRLWVAYEEGDEQWGKDYSSAEFAKIGLANNPGRPLYLKRTVRVRCLENGQVKEPAADLQAALMSKTANNKSVPRLAVDGAGGLWLLYRHHPRPFGIGEVWNSFAVRYDGQKWSTVRRLGNSANLMDNRPALAAVPQGMMIVFSGDARNNQLTRKQAHLYAALLRGTAVMSAPALVPAPPNPPAQLAVVHPNEARDIERFRAYRFEHEGKKLRMIRGEFHRHTEYTAHRDGDGLLEDAWRYAHDTARLDWMGNGDHDNGHHDEYSWWQIQKTADVMHHGPEFIAVQSYERSVKYPDGHRNVIFPKRGIRPLPRGSFEGTEQKGTPDTFVLYKYLHHFKAMCSSHTSATGMGTDWRNNDPVVEPVVEVYQGHRHNYEFPGAPRSATQKTNIGGFEPKGFIVHALDKGYKLGFQSSSDHVSTHMSYGILLTGDVSRQGIIDTFKRRHSYAATDNIIAEFRCGKQIMGDIFDVAQPPTFEVKVLGTAPIAKISILRDAKVVYLAEPKNADVLLRYTDVEAPRGKTSYYYVRVEQSDGNLAWLSPMWITYGKK